MERSSSDVLAATRRVQHFLHCNACGGSLSSVPPLSVGSVREVEPPFLPRPIRRDVFPAYERMMQRVRFFFIFMSFWFCLVLEKTHTALLSSNRLLCHFRQPSHQSRCCVRLEFFNDCKDTPTSSMNGKLSRGMTRARSSQTLLSLTLLLSLFLMRLCHAWYISAIPPNHYGLA
jgi:hypothetical protein